MKLIKVAILGSGGHAKSCIEAIERTNNIKIIGLIDKNKKKKSANTKLLVMIKRFLKLKRLQKVVLLELVKVYPEGLTGSEIANRTGYSILSIRPRTTELKIQKLIIDTEKTRKNEGGKSEIIYQLRSLYVIEDYDLHKDKTDKK